MQLTETMREALLCIESEDAVNAPVLLGDAIREAVAAEGLDVTWRGADAIARRMLGTPELDPLGETTGKVYVEPTKRELRDALGAELFHEPDGALRAMIDAPVGDVSETTRELARLELEARTAKASDA